MPFGRRPTVWINHTVDIWIALVMLDRGKRVVVLRLHYMTIKGRVGQSVYTVLSAIHDLQLVR